MGQGHHLGYCHHLHNRAGPHPPARSCPAVNIKLRPRLQAPSVFEP